MDKKELISVDASRTLAHVALLAAWEGDGDAANQIFQALYAAKPKEPNIRICQAMVLACQDRFAESTAMLGSVLAEKPDDLHAKSLLGLIKFHANEKGWRSLMEEVVKDGGDTDAAELARGMLADHPDDGKPIDQQGHALKPFSTNA